MLVTKLVLVVTFALVEPRGAVVGVGHHDHPVSWRCRNLFTPSGDTARARAPGPVVADHAGVVRGLELRDAGHDDALVMAWKKKIIENHPSSLPP